MAIIIDTNEPDLLLEKIYEAIDNKQAGKWVSTTDGRLTYGTLLWKNEAFFRPQIWVDENQLRFGLLKRKDQYELQDLHYFPHRMIELLLSQFDQDFRRVLHHIRPRGTVTLINSHSMKSIITLLLLLSRDLLLVRARNSIRDDHQHPLLRRRSTCERPIAERCELDIYYDRRGRGLPYRRVVSRGGLTGGQKNCPKH